MTNALTPRATAKAAGETHYHGPPCKHGHGTLRYVGSGSCVNCRIERAQKWMKANPERAQGNTRKWTKANPERVRETIRKWNMDNPERVRENARKWNNAHSDYFAAWRKANPERVREKARKWQKAHPDKCCANTVAREARKIRATPPWTTSAMEEGLQEWFSLGFILSYSVDHIVPLRGEKVSGLHVPWNMQTLILSDNCVKGNRMDWHPKQHEVAYPLGDNPLAVFPK